VKFEAPCVNNCLSHGGIASNGHIMYNKKQMSTLLVGDLEFKNVLLYYMLEFTHPTKMLQ